MINNLPEKSVFSLGGIGNCQKRVNYLSVLYADGVRVGLEDFIYEDENRIKLIVGARSALLLPFKIFLLIASIW